MQQGDLVRLYFLAVWMLGASFVIYVGFHAQYGEVQAMPECPMQQALSYDRTTGAFSCVTIYASR